MLPKRREEDMIVIEDGCCGNGIRYKFNLSFTEDEVKQLWGGAAPVVSMILDNAFKKFFRLIMEDGSFLRLDGNYRGTRISCLKGKVYITQRNDIKDYILSDNESFFINRKGIVIAWSVSGASIEVTSPCLDKYCVVKRLRRFIAL